MSRITNAGLKNYITKIEEIASASPRKL